MGQSEISPGQVIADENALDGKARQQDAGNAVSSGALCPSAPWKQEGAVVFGIAGGTAKAPRVMFLKQMMAPAPELEAKLKGVEPEEVFRVAAPCAGARCQHHNGETKGCNLATNIVQQVDQVYDQWATCGIRANCVWWAQEGTKACVRCPQIATRNKVPSEEIRRASTPSPVSA